MERSLQKSVEIITDVLIFFDEVKIDKKYRKRKEDLIVSLRVYLETTKGYVTGSTENHSDSGEFYKECLPDQSGELYNDLECPDACATYTDNATEAISDTIYDDNELEGHENYNDVAIPAGSNNIPPNQPSPIASPGTIPSTACEDLRNASVAEFLEFKKEKSVFSGAWQKRWCVVHRNTFYIYESSKDKKQKEAFSLYGFTFSLRDEITKETKRKGRTFEIRNTQLNKIYEFCVNDKESMNKWKNSLERAIRMAPSQRDRSLSSQSENTGVNSSPKKNKFNINLGALGNLKNKIKSSSSLASHSTSVSDTGDVYEDNVVESEMYNDTAGGGETYEDTVTTQQQEDTYVDNVNETYDEVEAEKKPVKESPYAKRPLPTPNITTTSLPRVPAPTPTVPPTSTALKLPPRELGQNHGESPPLPPPLSNTSGPVAPPRPFKDRDPALSPPLPGRDPDKGSGSGTFIKPSSPLPPTPMEKIGHPSPRIGKVRKERATDKTTYFDENDDEKYKDVDVTELYQGMWDCWASDSNELSFKRGQIVHVVSKDYDDFGWWVAKRENEFGLVPKDYLMEAYER